MRASFIFNCLAVLLLFAACSVTINAQISMQSRVQLQSKKGKKSKIKYKWQYGHALLKSGLKIQGKFKFQHVKNDVPYWVYLEDKKGAKKKFIDVSLYENLTLVGAEFGVTERTDSTFYEWIPQYSDLLRRVKAGKISVYDNSRIVNERYKGLDNFYVVAVKADGKARKLTEMKDLSVLIGDKPYFMKAARATGKAETRDLRAMFYVIDLYNSELPMDLLKWKFVELKLKNGKKIKGNGLVQAFDLRNEYNTPSEAMVHFYGKKDFELFADNEIKSITVGKQVWEKGFYPLTNKNFYGIPWKYNGREFLVTPRIINRNSFYFQSRKEEIAQSLIVLENLAGSYRKPDDEAQLRQFFLSEYNF